MHWPPHVGDRVAKIVATGDRIKALGSIETGPAGDRHFEVQSVTNQRTSVTMNVADVAGLPPPVDRGSDTGIIKTVRGTIDRFTTAPRGEVDGAVLGDGSMIHWPPHLASKVTSVLNKGDRVRATGGIETGPAGDTHLEVQSLTNVRTNDVVENDAAPPPQFARQLTTGRRGDVDRRVRDLQTQLDQIQREIDRLRSDLVTAR